MDINLQGTVRCMREGLALLKDSKSGAIVNMSSIMNMRHVRQLSAYAASKAAIASLTRSVCGRICGLRGARERDLARLCGDGDDAHGIAQSGDA